MFATVYSRKGYNTNAITATKHIHDELTELTVIRKGDKSPAESLYAHSVSGMDKRQLINETNCAYLYW